MIILFSILFLQLFEIFCEKIIKGLITKIESKDHYILTEKTDEIIRCTIRGKLKKEFNLKKDKLYSTDFASVGDVADYDLNQDGDIDSGEEDLNLGQVFFAR